jgi:hypothetical protein
MTNLCLTCKYCFIDVKKVFFFFKSDPIYFCSHSDMLYHYSMNLVNGHTPQPSMHECSSVRSHHRGCGPEGNLWESRLDSYELERT